MTRFQEREAAGSSPLRKERARCILRAEKRIQMQRTGEPQMLQGEGGLVTPKEMWALP